MGVDFIQKSSRTFEKHLDLARAKLGTADLFTRSPMEDRPSFPIKTTPTARLQSGQELTVEVSGESLVFRDVLSVVATVDTPAADMFGAVQGSAGMATAIVQEVHDLSGVAEVTLC
jgi:hypothetical protein